MGKGNGSSNQGGSKSRYSGGTKSTSRPGNQSKSSSKPTPKPVPSRAQPISTEHRQQLGLQGPPSNRVGSGVKTETGGYEVIGGKGGNQNQVPPNKKDDLEKPDWLREKLAPALAKASDAVGQHNEDRKVDWSGVVQSDGVKTASSKQYTTIGKRSKEVDDIINQLGNLSA